MGASRDTPDASVICDRSGGKYKMKDMVKEPGTGYLVHRRFSDDEWNAVDHPANNIQKYVKFDDPVSVQNARPDVSWDVSLSTYLTNEDGDFITNERGDYINI